MRFRSEICVLLLFVTASGCALISRDATDQLQNSREDDGLRDTMKPAAVPVKRIVRLSSSVITQPTSESRVREAVWQQMCESCLKRPQTRRRLNETGFRVGVSQPPYPMLLDSLLRTSGEQQRQPTTGRNSANSPMFFAGSGDTGVPLVIPEGTESLVDIRYGYGSEIPSDVMIPGLAGIAPEEQIRCALRIETLESGDGWSLVKFRPELHYGSETMRLTVRDGQEHLPVRQKVVPLFEQQFELKLRAGDIVVLGYDPQKQWSTGRFFFVADAVSGAQERLVVLQVTDIESVEGRPSVQVNYRKF